MLAEVDILLVLKNSILWYLECKSFAANTKDLDTRLLHLQQAGSQLAWMALCVPLLTGHAEKTWFKSQHELRQRIEASRRLTFVPFTLPGQPSQYRGGDGEEEYACPTLEEVLQRTLGGYWMAGA